MQWKMVNQHVIVVRTMKRHKSVGKAASRGGYSYFSDPAMSAVVHSILAD